MLKKFLVQFYGNDDNGLYTALWTENEVIKYTCESDIYGICDMIVFDISKFGEIKPLSYAGWRPMCEIIWHDAEGNVVIHGYGEDH